MSKHIGSTLSSLLEELGEKEDVELLARKKLVADTFQQRMKALSITTSELASRMKTSRNQVHRLLDPAETGVTFKSLDRASRALGLTFAVTFAPDAGPFSGRGKPRRVRAPASTQVAAGKKVSPARERPTKRPRGSLAR